MRHWRLVRYSVVVALLGAAFAVGLDFSPVQVSDAADRPIWPQDKSDLKPDAAVRFGVLPNGLRYAIKPNRNPQGTVTLRMRLAAGSLHENENELGVAHFLEHMAFNGSENYPEGEMFKALQRLGVQIGSSANASTDFDNTTFALSLPSTRPDTLNVGFKVLREIVGRLTLSAEAITRERGVILSEERARDTPGMRANLAQLHALFAGQKYPNRFPIGKLEFIKSATPAQLRSFYERHYRPERALAGRCGRCRSGGDGGQDQGCVRRLVAAGPGGAGRKFWRSPQSAGWSSRIRFSPGSRRTSA